TPPPPPLPPGCTIQQPTGTVATLWAQCDPYPYTSYNMWWNETCPGAVSYYQVEHSQPPGGIFVPTGPGPQPVSEWTRVFVSGVPAEVRVRACNGGGCTVPSNSV